MRKDESIPSREAVQALIEYEIARAFEAGYFATPTGEAPICGELRERYLQERRIALLHAFPQSEERKP